METEDLEDSCSDFPDTDHRFTKTHDSDLCCESSDEDICRLLRKFDRMTIVREFFRNPVQHFRKNPEILAAVGIVSGIIISITFVLSLSSWTSPVVAFIIIPVFSASIFPYIVFNHMRHHRIELAEEKVPEILREIADRVKGGKIPDISRELLFRNGFSNGSEIIQKAAFIAKTSEKAGGRIPDALVTAAEDAKEKIADRKEKKSKMQPYAYVMIASYLIFLGIITFLVFSIFGSIGNDFGMSGAGGIDSINGNPLSGINFINGITMTDSVISKMDQGFSERLAGLSKSAICIFHALVIQGFFCGLICGKIISGRISDGLIYSVFCVMCSWMLWIILI